MIKVAVVGMGNLGKACAEIVNSRPDMELVGTFNRQTSSEIFKLQGKIDVVLICVGSQCDAPSATPAIAKVFNTVDSYDNHGNMQRYVALLKSPAAIAAPPLQNGEYSNGLG